MGTRGFRGIFLFVVLCLFSNHACACAKFLEVPMGNRLPIQVVAADLQQVIDDEKLGPGKAVVHTFGEGFVIHCDRASTKRKLHERFWLGHAGYPVEAKVVLLPGADGETPTEVLLQWYTLHGVREIQSKGSTSLSERLVRLPAEKVSPVLRERLAVQAGFGLWDLNLPVVLSVAKTEQLPLAMTLVGNSAAHLVNGRALNENTVGMTVHFDDPYTLYKMLQRPDVRLADVPAELKPASSTLTGAPGEGLSIIVP